MVDREKGGTYRREVMSMMEAAMAHLAKLLLIMKKKSCHGLKRSYFRELNLQCKVHYLNIGFLCCVPFFSSGYSNPQIPRDGVLSGGYCTVLQFYIRYGNLIIF